MLKYIILVIIIGLVGLATLGSDSTDATGAFIFLSVLIGVIFFWVTGIDRVYRKYRQCERLNFGNRLFVALNVVLFLPIAVFVLMALAGSRSNTKTYQTTSGTNKNPYRQNPATAEFDKAMATADRRKKQQEAQLRQQKRSTSYSSPDTSNDSDELSPSQAALAQKLLDNTGKDPNNV